MTFILFFGEPEGNIIRAELFYIIDEVDFWNIWYLEVVTQISKLYLFHFNKENKIINVYKTTVIHN